MPLNNVNLSDYLLAELAGPSRWRAWTWLIRELPGIILVLGYLFAAAAAAGQDGPAPFFIKMGFVRFFLLVTLIQFMAVAADQDGAALDDQPEVHRVHPGVLLQHLTSLRQLAASAAEQSAGSLTAGSLTTIAESIPWPPPTNPIAIRRRWTSSSACRASLMLLSTLWMFVAGLQPRVQGRPARVPRRRGGHRRARDDRQDARRRRRSREDARR